MQNYFVAKSLCLDFSLYAFVSESEVSLRMNMLLFV